MTTAEYKNAARRIECEEDGLYFTRYFFKQRTGSRMIVAPHHKVIQQTLDRVIDGDIRRLVINVPPGYTKTELATINMMGRGLALNRRARFMHLSYSHNLALLNSSTTRSIVKSAAFQGMWPMALRDDADSKAMWWTEYGGGVYASSAAGQVTGFRAGHMEPGWQGCFPAGTLVETERGPRRIEELVESRSDFNVWSCNIETGNVELQPIVGWWENPANDIVEVGLSDGTVFQCTPDHRIYTSRGYVRADLLTSSDLLPACSPHTFQLNDSHSEQFGRFNHRQGVIEKSSIRNRTQPSSSTFVSAGSESLSDRCPGLSKLNLPNYTYPNSVLASKDRGRFVADKDCAYLSTCKLGSRTPLKNRKGSMSLCIRHVLSLSTPGKIIKSVIGRAAIKVTPFLSRFFWTYKGVKNKLVNVFAFYSALKGETHPIISPSVQLKLKHNSRKHVLLPGGGNYQPVQTADATISADFVNPLISIGRSPLFVRSVGHISKTYCLSVRSNHNFILSNGKVLVHNCLVLDDPVKPDDAFSETVRNGVNTRFNETIRSRLAIETTPIVVIMQRIHYQDLSGYLLRGGSGEHWHHLNLPVVIDNSEPYSSLYPENSHAIPIEHGLPDGWLWPYKHNESHRISLFSHRRTAEAQYMQRPRRFNAEGALWTEALVSDARTLEIALEPSRTVVAIDPQATNNEDSDETGIVVASSYGRGNDRLFSANADYSGKFTPNGWAKRAMRAYEEHRAEAIVIETNQGGDMAEDTLRNAGFRGRIIRVHASKGKFARAEPISALYEQGRVAHRGNLYQLENQLLEYVPATAKKSPDRLDALVWAITELFQPKGTTVRPFNA
ncbi:intein/intein [Pantoea sp. PNA 14-12]|nr:intein/intein [Pantoea sp. PNA 14-12]